MCFNRHYHIDFAPRVPAQPGRIDFEANVAYVICELVLLEVIAEQTEFDSIVDLPLEADGMHRLVRKLRLVEFAINVLIAQ